jgi:hypothetical protein
MEITPLINGKSLAVLVPQHPLAQANVPKIACPGGRSGVTEKY